MRNGKTLIALSLLALLAVTAALCGCGGTSGSDSSDTVVGNGKSHEVSDRVPTEEELGVPFYPGSKVDEQASGSIETSTKDGTAEFVGVNLITNAPYDEVVAWYSDKLSGMPGFVNLTVSSGAENTLYSIGSGKTGRLIGIDKDPSGNARVSIASIPE